MIMRQRRLRANDPEMQVKNQNMGPNMKPRILIIGEDPAVSRMRMQMLIANYDVTAVRPEESLRQPSGEVIDLLLICHTVRLREAASIIVAAMERYYVERALWLAEWQTVPSEDVMRIDGSRQPWLVEIEKMLKTKLLTRDFAPTAFNATRKTSEMTVNSR